MSSPYGYSPQQPSNNGAPRPAPVPAPPAGGYATLKEWYDNSSDAQDALADFKKGCEKVGPTDISTVGTDTLEVRITIDDLDDEAAKEIFTDPVQQMFALDAHTFKEHISGPVKFHVIGQNDEGQTYFDETYKG